MWMAMMSVPCENCSVDADLYTQINGWAGDPGYRVFLCRECGHFTWQKWSPAMPQQQQQQSNSA
jgi:hypothetical protein